MRLIVSALLLALAGCLIDVPEAFPRLSSDGGGDVTSGDGATGDSAGDSAGDDVGDPAVGDPTPQVGQIVRPLSDDCSGGWVAVPAGQTLAAVLDEGAANDNDFAVSAGSPTSDACAVLLQPVTVPLPESFEHVVRYRYRISGSSGTWNLLVNLENAPGSSVHTESIVDSGDRGWTTAEYTLATGEVSNISNYSGLRLNMVASVTGANDWVGNPGRNVAPGGWQVVGATTLWEAIDEGTTIVDADYARSPTLGEGASSSYRLGLVAIEDPIVHTGHQIVFRHRGSHDGIDLAVALFDDATEIANTSVPTSISWTTETWLLSEAEAELIADYGALELVFTFTNESVSLSSTTLEVSGLVGANPPGAWVGTWQDIRDQDSAFMENTNSTTNDRFTAELQNATDPLYSSGHTFYLRALRVSGAGGQNVDFELEQGSNKRATRSERVDTSSYTTYSFDLTAPEANSITDYGDLFLYVRLAEDAHIQVDRVWLEIPQAADIHGRIAGAYLTIEETGAAAISWAELQLQ